MLQPVKMNVQAFIAIILLAQILRGSFLNQFNLPFQCFANIFQDIRPFNFYLCMNKGNVRATVSNTLLTVWQTVSNREMSHY